MTEQQLLDDIEKITNYLPRSHDDLIKQIDRFIFGAQTGFDLITEYTALCFNKKSEFSTLYKRVLSSKYLEAENKNIAPTARKEYATMHSVDAEISMLKAENELRIARMRRDQWIERLNSYKKIKGDNINMRGAG
jgi:hypothetical protein